MMKNESNNWKEIRKGEKKHFIIKHGILIYPIFLFLPLLIGFFLSKFVFNNFSFSFIGTEFLGVAFAQFLLCSIIGFVLAFKVWNRKEKDFLEETAQEIL